MNYLLANTANGVWEVETLEGEECEILSQEDFLYSLGSIEDGKTIGAVVDPEHYSLIDYDYMIHFQQ